MVSQLSARLLSGRAAQGTSCERSAHPTAGNILIHQSHQQDSESGYSADRDGSGNESPPGTIDFRSRSRREYSSNERAKRRKLNERQFDAAFARTDLDRAGLPVPKIRTTNTRAIPLAKVDMSGVKLVFSGAVEASPFLNAGHDFSYHKFDVDAGQAYQEVINLSRFAYKAPTQVARIAESDSESSTSSLSETDNDDAQHLASSVLVINARVEDALKHKPRDQPKTTKQTETASLVSCPASITVSLEEALAVCQEARVMVLSNAPYTIIHSNAAFSRLSGIASSSILGRHLADLLHGGISEKFSLPSCVAASGSGSDTSVDLISKHDKQSASFVKCTMNVRPVMAASPKGHADRVSEVTHFVVDLTAVSQDSESTRQEAEIFREDTQSRIPTQVLG